MATIVYHRKRDLHYILLGGGFAAHRSATGSAIFGDLLPTVETGLDTCALVSDAEGVLCWVRTEFLEVVTVDGLHPREYLRFEE